MLEEFLTRALVVLFRAITSASEQARAPTKPLPHTFPRADQAEADAKKRLTATSPLPQPPTK